MSRRALVVGLVGLLSWTGSVSPAAASDRDAQFVSDGLFLCLLLRSRVGTEATKKLLQPAPDPSLQAFAGELISRQEVSEGNLRVSSGPSDCRVQASFAPPLGASSSFFEQGLQRFQERVRSHAVAVEATGKPGERRWRIGDVELEEYYSDKPLPYHSVTLKTAP